MKMIIIGAVTAGFGYILGSAITTAIAVEDCNRVYLEGMRDGMKLQKINTLAEYLYTKQKDRFSKEKEEA